MKNVLNISIKETLEHYQDKITIKIIVKEILKCLGKASVIFFLLFLFSFSIVPLIPFSIFDLFIELCPKLIFFAFNTSILVDIYKFAERLYHNKESKQEINEIIEELHKFDIETTKYELKRANIKDVEKTNGTCYLNNGKLAKKRTVVSYISIDKKDKLIILKEVLVKIKSNNSSYDNYNANVYLLDEDDKINEGIIYSNGKLTEKGKLLLLKTK